MNAHSGKLEIIFHSNAIRSFAIICVGVALLVPYLGAPVVVSIPLAVVAFFCLCQMHTVIDFPSQTLQQEHRFLGRLTVFKCTTIAFADVDWIGARPTREENSRTLLYTVELSLKNGRTIDLKQFHFTPKHPCADREAQELAAELSRLAGFQLRSSLTETVISREPSD